MSLLKRISCSLAVAAVTLALTACSNAADEHEITITASVRPPETLVLPHRASAAAAAEPPCGAGATHAAALAAGLVAQRIYALELESPEVRSDRRQIESYGPLLSALARGERAAVAQAVTSLVYSHTHVVRLRVSGGGGVLADVGGPYIIAPVSGTLRQGGRVLGHYVFSVQDDLGYVKLEHRFVGLPLILRTGSRRLPVEGTLAQSAAALPDSGPVDYAGQRYEAFTVHARAFPDSALRATLLVPASASAAVGCGAVRVAELGRIGRRVWDRFITVGSPLSSYPRALQSLTGALGYVRAGSRQIAGSSTPGPSRLPASGSVRYGGTRYRVISFAASSEAGQVRVYQLIAP